MSNYYLYRIGRFLAKVLPIQVSSALVMVLCDLHFRLSKTDRQAVENNLKIVHKTDHVPYQEVREVFRNFVHIKNIKYLNEVLQKGKGGIIVSAHLGNWEIAGGVLPMLGFPLSVVALAHQDPRVNALFNAQREVFGTMVIQADVVAVRRVLEHLHKNRLVTILADRDFRNHGIMMDFFGRKTMIPKGAAFFSMRTGAPIIPGFFFHTDDDHFVINVYPPIEPPHVQDGKITDEAARDYIQKYLTIIEDEIRKNPSQWLLFREFWKS